MADVSAGTSSGRATRAGRAPATKSAATEAPAVQEAIASAREAGLSYVSDARTGIRRERNGESFRYLDRDGSVIRDESVLARIRSLAIPPAWEDVWICPSGNGHLQATGWDARGRKQYRYHPKWRSVRDENKFGRLVDFAHALPAIRRRVAADLRLPGLPREKVLAAVVRLLETTFIRVGNERYAKENGSFGLTTMRNRHVRVRGEKIEFDFRGKSGVKHNISLKDAQLAKIIQRCRDLPGYELFEYVDGDGEVRSIESSDVNEYLKSITGQDYTAKDFRTWAGTVLAVQTLCRAECPRSESHAKSVLKNAVGEVAKQLGNTIAVCRKCYIHPRVLDTFLEGVGEEALPPALAAVASLPPSRKNALEHAVVHVLTAKARKKPTLTQSLKASIKKTRNARAEALKGGVRSRVRRRVASGRRVAGSASAEPARE